MKIQVTNTLRKNSKGGYGDCCCIPGYRSPFFNSTKEKTGIGFFNLAEEPKIRKIWLQVIRLF